MKNKNYDELTDNEFADWSARIMGWVRHRETEMHYAVWLGSCKNPLVAIENNQVGALYWNPRHSLDLCWLFEEWIIDECKHFGLDSLNSNWSRYRQNIFEIQGRTIELCVHATASQRCRALWLTMGGKE